MRDHPRLQHTRKRNFLIAFASRVYGDYLAAMIAAARCP